MMTFTYWSISYLFMTIGKFVWKLRAEINEKNIKCK